jgi:hypothetical protein
MQATLHSKRRMDPRAVGRSFGFPVGGVLVLISAYAAWRGQRAVTWPVLAVSLTLLLFAWLRPTLLERPGLLWQRFAIALGHVNARIILTVAFVLVFVPIGLVWRLIGRDPLARRRRAWPGWTPSPARYRERAHYTRMY